MIELLTSLDRAGGKLPIGGMTNGRRLELVRAVHNGWIELTDAGEASLTDRGAGKLCILEGNGLRSRDGYCRNGHRLNPETVYIRASTGVVECRLCRNDARRRNRARKREKAGAQ